MRALIPWLLVAWPALAQPADCPAAADQANSMPIYLNLQGRPGVPKGMQGGVFLNVPVGANASNCAPTLPPLPSDILHGNDSDGDTLRGLGGGNLLRGTPPTARVTVEGVN
jgi:hypothetical protein